MTRKHSPHKSALPEDQSPALHPGTAHGEHPADQGPPGVQESGLRPTVGPILSSNPESPMHPETNDHTSPPADLADAPAGQVKIGKIFFTLPIPPPYAEGHVLTALEARALNQTWVENLRNNFVSHITKARGEGESAKELTSEDISALQAKFDSYVPNYSFAVRSQRTPVDPVGHEAFKMAKTIILAALKKNNIDVKSLPEGKLDDMTSALLAKRPEIREEAQRRIDSTRAVSASVLEGMNLGAQAA